MRTPDGAALLSSGRHRGHFVRSVATADDERSYGRPFAPCRPRPRPARPRDLPVSRAPPPSARAPLLSCIQPSVSTHRHSTSCSRSLRGLIREVGGCGGSGGSGGLAAPPGALAARPGGASVRLPWRGARRNSSQAGLAASWRHRSKVASGGSRSAAASSWGYWRMI